MGENIGATARAMLNFGFTGLRLAAPRDGWPNPKAAAMAAGASLVIDQAQVYATIDEAIADCHYVLATTARPRELATPVMTPAEAAQNLKERIGKKQRCAVLFGGERSGLTSDDVARADGIISIPANPAFASINLAQAALIIAYEWGQCVETINERDLGADCNPAVRSEVQHFLRRLEQSLEEANYFFPAEKSDGMKRNLRAAISRAGFTKNEIHTLHGVVKALVRQRD